VLIISRALLHAHHPVTPSPTDLPSSNPVCFLWLRVSHGLSPSLISSQFSLPSLMILCTISYVPHMSETTWQLSFSDWLISLSIISSSFIHVDVNGLASYNCSLWCTASKCQNLTGCSILKCIILRKGLGKQAKQKHFVAVIFPKSIPWQSSSLVGSSPLKSQLQGFHWREKKKKGIFQYLWVYN